VWKAVHCAVQGRGHIKNNVPCQDKTFCCRDGDVAVVALADGAGSAGLSHHGAACITEYISKDFAKYFDIYFNCDDGVAVKKQLISKILHKLDGLCEELGCVKRDCASTLMVVAVSDGKFLLMHIGDGVVGYVRNNQIKIASFPENGEFANSTVFTTSPEAVATMKLLKGQLNGIDAFVIMSDGTAAGLFSKKSKNLSPVLLKVTDFVRYFPENTVTDMIEQSLETVVKQATTDDCSIAIIADDYFQDIRNLPVKEQGRLLGLSNLKHSDKKRLIRISTILDMLKKPVCETDIAKGIHLKKKYVKKYTDYLKGKGIIDENNKIFSYSEK